MRDRRYRRQNGLAIRFYSPFVYYTISYKNDIG